MITMHEKIKVAWSKNSSDDSQYIHLCPFVHMCPFLHAKPPSIEGNRRVDQLAKAFIDHDTDTFENF